MRILIAWGITVCAAAQTIGVTPPKAMMDEAVVVKVTGLAPNEHAAIRAELTEVRRKLGGPGASRRAAQAILRVVERH